MGRPPSVEAARRRAVTAWLDDAEADLANARTLSMHRDEKTSPLAAAFHAEQAVEKLLKALLIAYGIAYPPRHDLGLLVGLLPEGTAAGQVKVAGLTVYAVEQRYAAAASDPMSLSERPTWEEADEAIGVAAKALTAAAGDLIAAGFTNLE